MLWIKSLHIIFMVTWMAAIFYLPRLFVYHCQALAEGDERGDARFQVMERKLFWGIMTPGMALTWVFGLWLWLGYGIGGQWLMWKLLLVLLLTAFHVLCYWHLKQFRMGSNRMSETYYRWINELPVISLVGAVLLVVIKPA